jgi:hypothetical protein
MRPSLLSVSIILLLIGSSVLSGCDAIKFWEGDSGVRGTVSTSDKQVLMIRNRAAAIQSGIDGMERRDMAPFRLGDTVLIVTLYSAGGDITLIDERVEGRGIATARNRYYFSDASLFHFYGKSSRLLNPGAANPRTAEIRTRMYFNDAGNLFDQDHTINGLASELSEDELPSVLQRAFALRMLSQTDSSGAIDTTAFIATLYGGPGAAAEDVDTALANAPAGAPPVSEAIAGETQREQDAATLAAKTQQPQAARPQAVKPQAAKPQAAKPQAAKPQAPKPQAVKPQAEKPQAPKPQAPKPQVTKPQAPPAEFARDVDGDAAVAPHTHAMIPGELRSYRLLFPKGSTSAGVDAAVRKGQHIEYVLRARREQRMEVTLGTEHPDVYFRVFLRDGDISGQRRSWTGTIPRYGDYHVVVYVRGGAAANGEFPYNLTVSIQ